MPEQPGNIEILILKKLQQSLSQQEEEELKRWINESEDNNQLFKRLTDEAYLSDELARFYSYHEDEAWKRIKEALPSNIEGKENTEKKHFKPRILSWPQKAAAAMLVLVVGISIFLGGRRYKRNNAEALERSARSIEKPFLPAGNKAMLTLADGKTVPLDDQEVGAFGQQGSSKILNFKGKAIYKNNNSGTKAIVYNKIATPKGGQYEVVLADGSAVWLNAGSSIRFPTAFPSNERRVEITGEVYFEVAKQKTAPFIVSVNGAEIHVTGTHFNVMAYEEERVIKTTLLEGSVQFKKADKYVGLSPGQQSQLTQEGRIKVINEVDINEVMAWKNGSFYFQRADIETIMRQIERWYNVDVEFRNKKSPTLLHVDIPRNTMLSEVLKVLEIAGGLQFKMEGRKIIVM